MRPCLILLAAVMLNGCYLSHEDRSAPPVAPRDASRGDASVPTDGSVDPPIDGSVVPLPVEPTDPPGPPDPLPSGENICDQWCNAAVRAGCGRDSCVNGCVRRFEVAEEIGCTTEWKRATLCLSLDPCRDDGSCGTDNGWPQCLRDPPGR